MATEDETQGEYDDGGLPGPGAPTPLTALEVSAILDECRGQMHAYTEFSVHRE